MVLAFAISAAKAATVPGPTFYRNPDHGRTQLRFCYAKQTPDLERACKRLRGLRHRPSGRAKPATGTNRSATE